MRDSGRQRLRCLIIAVLLALTIGNPAVWANPETQSNLSPHTRVILFASGTGQWVPTTFARTKPGNEFFFNNQLYRVVDSDKAQVVFHVTAGRLVEADLPYDKFSHRPEAGDVVQVLGKDLRFVAHTALSAVLPGAAIRFQGKTYHIKADRSLTDIRATLPASTLQRIEITRSALQHIIDRHTVGGTMNAGKSTFSPGEDIRALIKNAELLTPMPQTRGNYQRVFDAGRTIGIDRRSGKQTSTYTVITTESGKLVTAFPDMP